MNSCCWKFVRWSIITECVLVIIHAFIAWILFWSLKGEYKEKAVTTGQQWLFYLLPGISVALVVVVLIIMCIRAVCEERNKYCCMNFILMFTGLYELLVFIAFKFLAPFKENKAGGNYANSEFEENNIEVNEEQSILIRCSVFQFLLPAFWLILFSFIRLCILWKRIESKVQYEPLRQQKSSRR